MKKMMMFGAACAAMMNAWAVLEPAALFNDNMVLQREKPVAVWGKADPGATVTIVFAGAEAKATADAKGAWRGNLPAMKADGAGKVFTITSSSGEKVMYQNVVVGEVWLCGGQSNMTFQLWPAPRVFQHAGREKNGYYDMMLTNEPEIRGVWIGMRWSAQPGSMGRQKWLPFTPGATGNFSGAAFHYALRLHQALHIPVGVISSAWGGSRIEPWIPASGFEQVPSVKALATAPITSKKKNADLHQMARACWNAMIYPLAPYTLRGAIWYQGESNRGEWNKYYDLLKALHAGWSKEFECPDMPFYLVQIAPYGYQPEAADPGATQIREEMERFAYTEKNCGIAVISDVGEVDNIHPGDKRTVGTRLAALALNRLYGFTNLVCDAPKFKSASAVQNGRVTLTFDYVKAWNMNGLYPLRFELAGADGKYEQVKAELKGNTVQLVVPPNMKPTKVAYMRKSCWHGFLKNEAGLPLGPFRAELGCAK